MILILSSRNDSSTFAVCEWLVFLKKEFFIIYDDDRLEILYIDMKSIIVKCNDKIIDSKKIKFFWHRTAFHDFMSSYDSFFKINQDNLDVEFSRHLRHWLYVDQLKILQVFNDVLTRIPNLSVPRTYDINRIIVLQHAKSIGLDVPNWIITTSKKTLLEFISDFEMVITKPIGWNLFFDADGNNYVFYTQLVTGDLINDLQHTFPPSFFQTFIKKKYELRVFFLEGNFYTTAFYPVNSTNCVDIRTEATNLSYRKIPYRLPCDVESKLTELMKSFDLKTASIDIIVGEDSKFYFLEINPTGQYEYINNKCNFSINEKIAKILASQYEKA